MFEAHISAIWNTRDNDIFYLILS